MMGTATKERGEKGAQRVGMFDDYEAVTVGELLILSNATFKSPPLELPLRSNKLDIAPAHVNGRLSFIDQVARAVTADPHDRRMGCLKNRADRSRRIGIGAQRLLQNASHSWQLLLPSFWRGSNS